MDAQSITAAQAEQPRWSSYSVSVSDLWQSWRDEWTFVYIRKITNTKPSFTPPSTARLVAHTTFEVARFSFNWYHWAARNLWYCVQVFVPQIFRFFWVNSHSSPTHSTHMNTGPLNELTLTRNICVWVLCTLYSLTNPSSFFQRGCACTWRD